MLAFVMGGKPDCPKKNCCSKDDNQQLFLEGGGVGLEERPRSEAERVEESPENLHVKRDWKHMGGSRN